MGRRGRGRGGQPLDGPPGDDLAEEPVPAPGAAPGPVRPSLVRTTGWLAAIGLLLLAGWWSRETVSSTTGRQILVLAETPALAELSTDSAALRYYASQGIGGVLVRAATLGSLASGRDVALASGDEILRLFRMEGIVNIFMWEQIRDRPLRADATYVFTNDLALHENILAALRRDLGEESSRPYRDGEHDFGGDIPGNYIIEVTAPIEIVRGIGVGVEGAVRQRLLDAELEPVVEVVTAADVKALPEPIPTLLVTGNAAAEALWAERRPERILLTKNVRNPGWGQAVLAERPSGETFTLHGGALIVPIAEAGPAIARLRTLNYGIGASPAIDRDQAGMRPWRTWAATACLAAALAWTITWLAGVAWAPATHAGAWVVAAVCAGMAPTFFSEAAGVLLASLTGFAVLRRAQGAPRREVILQSALGIAALMLSGQLVAVGRPVPDPWTVALVALGTAAAWRSQDSVSNPFLIAAIALAASRLIPASPLVISFLLVGTVAAPAFLRRADLLEALRLLAWPSALALLMHPEVPGPVRAGLAALSLAALSAPLFTPWRR